MRVTKAKMSQQISESTALKGQTRDCTASFIRKTYTMREQSTYCDIIGWSDDGKEIAIKFLIRMMMK